MQYFWKRFWRIYPAYFVALVLFYAFRGLSPQFDSSQGDFWAHVFLVHNFWSKYFEGISPAFWSLAVEAQFYLLYPLAVWMRKRWGMSAVFWTFLALSTGMRVIVLCRGHWDDPSLLYLWRSPLVLFVDWLLGAWLAEKLMSGDLLIGLKPSAALAFGVVPILLACNRYTGISLSFTAFSIWYAMLAELYLTSARPLRWWEKLAVPVGLCSYSIYLWHGHLVHSLIRCLHKLDWPDTPVGALAAMPISFLLMFLTGYVSWQLIEKKGIHLGYRLFAYSQRGEANHRLRER